MPACGSTSCWPRATSTAPRPWNGPRDRCPQAACHGVAVLADHGFRIVRHGVATVVPAASSVVYGVLWTLTRMNERALDRYKGVDAGFYRRQIVTVGFDGRDASALIYVATDATLGQPRAGYLESVIAAARSHGLPDAYIAEMGRWQTG